VCIPEKNFERNERTMKNERKKCRKEKENEREQAKQNLNL
jgi:hypothetical protein